MKIRCKYTKKVPLEDLVPNPRNPNTHPEDQVKLLAKIMEFQGWRSPVVVSNLSGYIVRGHGRLLAGRILGLETIPVDFQDYDNEAQEWADLVADNRIAELAEMDRGTLKDLIEELDTGDLDLDLTGFDEGSLADLMSEFFVPDEGLTDDDEIPEDVKPRTKTGDLWQLGDHRILCGDSTKADDVKKVTNGGGDLMMVTDPPYGVNYEGGQANEKKRQKIEGDSTTDILVDALAVAGALMPKGSWYIWHAGKYAEELYRIIRKCGFEVRALIIWNKLKAHYGAPSSHYCQKHEPCLYAVKGTADFIGASNEVTVWDIEQPHRNELHPTQKPMECMERAIRNHKTKTILDPFLGSGTTLIACEKLKRICYGIEIDPGYCDVAIQRWENFTGQKAKKVRK